MIKGQPLRFVHGHSGPGSCRPALDRFLEKTVYVGDCIVWTGTSKDGYGRFKIDGKTVYAHRWIYEYVHGPLPDGFEPDHLCRNTICVNLSHLEGVTHRVNVLRGIGPSASHAKVTHCPFGHPFHGDNLLVYVVLGHKKRVCRACKNFSSAKSRHATTSLKI